MGSRRVLKEVLRAGMLGVSSGIVIGWRLPELIKLVCLFVIVLRVIRGLEIGQERQKMTTLVTGSQSFVIQHEEGGLEGLELTTRVATGRELVEDRKQEAARGQIQEYERRREGVLTELQGQLEKTQGSEREGLAGSDKRKGKYYAVRRGRLPGIYRSWEACKEQVEGISRARYKSFWTLGEAEEFMRARDL
jgi:hypothetical protein